MKKAIICCVNPWDMEIDPVATGKQLRKKRLKFNLTQEGLSEVICRNCVESASRNAISTWETGKKLPSLQHVKFLARLYRCSLDELVLSYGESRDSEGRDQPVPSNLSFLRRMYAERICSPFCFVTLWFTEARCAYGGSQRQLVRS